MSSDVVVVLTAFNAEYTAVQRHLIDRQIQQERGTRFEVGRLPGTRCRVALCLTGKGNQPAAVIAERAIRRYAPAAVLFVGVAGGLSDTTSLGDVVVATYVYAYHGGTSEDDGFKARPRGWETAHEIQQLAAQVDRAGDWAPVTAEDLRAPRVHFGAIAAGEVVQNSWSSNEAARLRLHYNDALAIEMEAAGVAQAGHLNRALVAVVRGISDRADGAKTSTADRTWQPRAVANAAAFALRLAEKIIEERGRAMPDVDARRSTGGVVNTNNSGQVGIQGGEIAGSTVIIGGSVPAAGATDLAAELAAIRDQLGRERAAGAVDEATYQAAQEELGLADAALAGDGPQHRSRFALALKRLRGLVADITDLGTRIATLIKTVSGSS